MFYEKLEKEIEKRNINLNILAKETGISQPTTNKWKNGGLPGANALIKICKYLKVSADYLLDLDDSPPPPHLSDQETELLEHFRLCKPEIQEFIIGSVKSAAQETLRQETSLELKNIG